MVSDLSLVMDVPQNLSKRADYMSFVISYFQNSLMILSPMQLNNVMRAVKFFFFSGLIIFTIPLTLGCDALLRFNHEHI